MHIGSAPNFTIRSTFVDFPDLPNIAKIIDQEGLI